MSSKKNKPKPSAKTLRDRRKAKQARHDKRKAKRSLSDRIKAPEPTRGLYDRCPTMPAGFWLNNLIALGMPGIPRPPRRPSAILT